MDLQEAYKKLIRKNTHNPKKTLRLMNLGLFLLTQKMKIKPDKKLPPSLQYLNTFTTNFSRRALTLAKDSGMVNLFTSTEILQAFGITPFFTEAFAAYLSGFGAEDIYLNIAESHGAPESLCSYHKALVGAVENNLLPKFKFALTTSTACDSNITTFRRMAEKNGTRLFVLDVPYQAGAESENYLIQQLKELIAQLENLLHKKIDYNKLRKIIQRENETLNYMTEFIRELSWRYFPNSLGLEMNKLYTSHLFLGTPEVLKFYQLMARDIKKFGRSAAKRIMWINIMPHYHQVLNAYFSFNPRYQLLGSDYNLIYYEQLDARDPLRSIARKMINDRYNQNYEHRIENYERVLNELKPDAIIHFNHWGCKQTNGGVMLFKEVAKQKKIPFLAIDGDGIDQRNSHDEQIRTRVGAFLEMLDKN